MPSASLHLTHAELLAKEPNLHPALREAMAKEITYARLGSIFPDLPFYTNIVTMMLGYWLEMPAEKCPFAQKMHRHLPELFAWHFLSHAQKDHLLTREQRLALLGGFFAHVALDLEIHPLVNWSSRRDMLLHGGNESHHHRLVEKYHSLFFHTDLLGNDVVGYPSFFNEKCLIVDDPPFIRLHMALPVIRWSADMLAGFYQESAPNTYQIAHWIRSFRHFSFMVSLSAARRNSKRLGHEANRKHYYENTDFRFIDFWDRAYARSIELLNLACEIFLSSDTSDLSRSRFLSKADIGDLAYPPEKNLPPLPAREEPELPFDLTA